MKNMNSFDNLNDLGKPRKIVNQVNLKFRFYSEKPDVFPIKFVL